MGRHQVIKDEDLLKVARRVFQEKGHAATTRDVAEAAGISQAALYQRFRTKDELVLAAMLPPLLRMDHLLSDESPMGPSGKLHLVKLMLIIVAQLKKAGPALLFLATYPSANSGVRSRAHKWLAESDLKEGLARHIKALQDRGDADPTHPAKAVAESLFTHAWGLSLLRTLSGGGTDQEEYKRIQDFLHTHWEGLLRRSKRDSRAKRDQQALF
jgi:AcrR family transcriptional regulator